MFLGEWMMLGWKGCKLGNAVRFGRIPMGGFDVPGQISRWRYLTKSNDKSKSWQPLMRELTPSPRSYPLLKKFILISISEPRCSLGSGDHVSDGEKDGTKESTSIV